MCKDVCERIFHVADIHNHHNSSHNSLSQQTASQLNVSDFTIFTFTTHHQLAGFVGHEVKIQKTDLLSWSKCSRFRRLIIFGYIWTSLSKYWLDIISVGSFKQSRTYETNSALLMIESCKNIVKSC